MNKIFRLFFWLFLISLPFGFRILLFKFTPGFDEYEAIFLYASDVLMVLFLVFTIKNLFSFMRLQRIKSNLAPDENFPPSSLRSRVPGKFSTRSEIFRSLPAIFTPKRFFIGFLYVFLFFSGLSIFFASYKLLAFYNFIRLVLLVLTALAIAEIIKRNWVKLENILAVLVVLAGFQSLVAFFQFVFQKSLGLWFLGESVLGQGIPGTAKIVVEGIGIMRGYGTFPHPNVLAAFLLLGLFCSYYLFFKVLKREKKIWPGLLSVAAIFMIILGLILAFSRAAWLLGLALTLVFIFCLSRQKEFRRQICYFSAILFFIFLVLISGLNQLIFARAQISLNEPAVSQRISYNELGWYLIKTHPLGVGLGNQVVYSVENGTYRLLGMNQVWQWQPIHNIYLLMGSEIGVLGLAAFLIFIAKLSIKNIKFFVLNKISEISYASFAVLMMFLSLLGFGLFDHFLWTLQPGRLMLWLVLGIMLGSSPRS